MFEFFTSADAFLEDRSLARVALLVVLYGLFVAGLILWTWIDSKSRSPLRNWKEPERHEP